MRSYLTPLVSNNDYYRKPSGVNHIQLIRGDFLSIFDKAYCSWWAMLGSNQRPLPCEGSALPLS